MRSKRSVTRTKILDAAYELSRKRGFFRVNVDEIAEGAGLTKRTLYAHFSSKDALLEAVLEAQHALALAAFDTFGAALRGTPEDIVRAYFRELRRWSNTPRFPGSGFTRLAMEMADLPGHPARSMTRRHKLLLEERLGEVLEASGSPKRACGPAKSGCSPRASLPSRWFTAMMPIAPLPNRRRWSLSRAEARPRVRQAKRRRPS